MASEDSARADSGTGRAVMEGSDLFDPERIEAVADRARQGYWGPLARIVTHVENSPPWEVQVPKPEKPCHLIGITGPPGAGKSTLTGRLIETLVEDGQRVAVVAIDPSSPMTGGAVLGDRLRMENHLENRSGVFVRSLASRGAHGAVAGSTRNIARFLELTGLFDVILIETVGAGQTEVAIVEVADTVILVTVPGLGDAVQAIKAGFMEIADALVVNQADRPGAGETVRHLRQAARSTDIYQTVAIDGTGLPDLWTGVKKRWTWLNEGDRLTELRREKWGSDAALVAEAWVADCAESITTDPDHTMHESVHHILKEASSRWTQ